jgi:hypothetical protein
MAAKKTAKTRTIDDVLGDHKKRGGKGAAKAKAPKMGPWPKKVAERAGQKTWTCRSEIGVRSGCGKNAKVVDLVRHKRELAEKVEKAQADLDKEIETAKQIEADKAKKVAEAAAAGAEKAAAAEAKKLEGRGRGKRAKK